MSIAALANALPNYAEDLKINLAALSAETILTDQQKWGAFLASAYALKIAIRRDGYLDTEPSRRTREFVIAAISTLYTLFLMWAAGYVFLFLACILLAPATALYLIARRQQGEKAFTKPGLAIFIAVLPLAVIGVVLLATGEVQL